MIDRAVVAALARGLDILQCFDQPGIEIGVSALARRVGLSQPTTWRLCQTLIERGFLQRAANGTGLRIGVPALTLGYAAIKGMRFPDIALPYMREVTQEMQISTTLSTREGIEMISVCRCDGAFVIPNQPIGWRSTLTSVPSGLAFLAAIGDAERDAAAKQIEGRDPAAWPRRAARLERAIIEYRRCGWVTHDTMMGGKYAAVAVPLLATTPGTSQAWAISCGGLASLLDAAQMQRFGERLLKLRALLQPALGAPVEAMPA